MRCTKCHYLSFEPEPRCKNCGHDLSLEEGSPFSEELQAVGAGQASAYAAAVMAAPKTATSTNSSRIPTKDLPLFVQSMQSVSDQLAQNDDRGYEPEPEPEELEPLVKVPARPRNPVSVRRPTPDPARLRAKYGMSSSTEPDLWSNLPADPIDQVALHDEPQAFDDLPLTTSEAHQWTTGQRDRGTSDSHEQWASESEEQWVSDTTDEDRVPVGWEEPVSVGARIGAALIDAVLLVGIAAAVIYLTLQVSGLSLSQIALLPLLPMTALLLMMAGGYFLMFTLASAQTVGKMAMHIKVPRTRVEHL